MLTHRLHPITQDNDLQRFMLAFIPLPHVQQTYWSNQTPINLFLTTLQTNISQAREYFLQNKTESSTQDTYKNLELTAKVAARQEYSTGISEAQEYSK